MFNILFIVISIISSIGVVLALIGAVKHYKGLAVSGLVIFGLTDFAMFVLIVLKFIGILV